MEKKMTLADAAKQVPEALPMEAEIWGAGADHETARFVAGQLRRQGYYLVRAEDIGWDDIKRFNAELGKGQAVHEDGGGYFVRAIMALFGKKPDPVQNYQDAAKELLENANR